MQLILTILLKNLYRINASYSSRGANKEIIYDYFAVYTKQQQKNTYMHN